MSPPVSRSIWSSSPYSMALNHERAPNEALGLSTTSEIHTPELETSSTGSPPNFRTSGLWRSRSTSAPESDFSWAMLGEGLLLAALGILNLCGCSSSDSSPGSRSQSGSREIRRPREETPEEATAEITGDIRVGDLFEFEAPLTMATRTELEGDPSLGTIHYLRQVHYRPELDGPLSDESLRTMVLVAEHQFAMLLELERLRPNHVFSENISAQSVRDWDRILTMRHHRRAAVLFDPVPDRFEDLNMEAVETIFHLGAADIYMIRHPEAEYHETVTQALFDAEMDTMARLETERGLLDEDLALTETAATLVAPREAFVTERILEFFAAHPGETIALQYGLAHEFSDNFSSAERSPRLISYAWDR